MTIRQRSAFRQQGFTLIELMVTIAILAILAAIAYPSYETYIQRSRMENARAAMTDVIQHLERHYTARNSFCAAAGNDCQAPDISAIVNAKENLRYDIAFGDTGINQITADHFTLIATPKDGLYSADKRASRNLEIFYDSTSAAFARCNSAGLSTIKAGEANGDPSSNCEVY